jgi:hypothetical protein
MPVPLGSVVFPQPDLSRTISSTPRMRAASNPGRRAGRSGVLRDRRVRQNVEAELQRVLARCRRELVDERLRREGDAVAARGAQGAGRDA